MNRPIRFRAWNTFFSDLPIYNKEHDEKGTMVYLEATHSLSHLEDLNNWKVMQFTGLKDSKGVEIYEGDVVYLSGYGNYEVKFPFIQLYEAGQENDIGEIKGNIYENPNLINL